jgi:hypothetical protein
VLRADARADSRRLNLADVGRLALIEIMIYAPTDRGMDVITGNVTGQNESHCGGFTAYPGGSAQQAAREANGEFLAYLAVIVCGHMTRIGVDPDEPGDFTFHPGLFPDLAGCGLADRLARLDPADKNRIIPPPLGMDAEQLADVIRDAAELTWFATVDHPARPGGWDIAWGRQLDIRTVRMTGSGQVTDTAVASYLAKYATKSTEAIGAGTARITAATLAIYGRPATHQGRLIAAAWRLGHHPHEDFRALRRWAHMLGFRGHFSTKSRRYSTTLRALRAARHAWRRRQTRDEADLEETTLVITALNYQGQGWRTTADEYLALSAAARAREHQRTARDEAMCMS